MASLMWQRDVVQSANDVKNTFSSWDSCMSKTYCKWPVIVAIIIGSLIILSFLWCCVRCCCLGAECCCGCLSCCNACCPSPRKKGYKQQENPAPPYYPPPQGFHQPQPYHAQYQSPIAPKYQSPVQQPPQFATFDASSGKKNEDALPAMPSWDNAASSKVEVEDEAVEMNHLDQNGQRPGMAARQPSNSATNVSSHGGGAAGYGQHYDPPSPLEPEYGQGGAYGGGYAGQQTGFRPAQDMTGYHGQSTGGYRGAAPAPVADISRQQNYHAQQGYDSQQTYSPPQGYERQQNYSPHQDFDRQPDYNAQGFSAPYQAYPGQPRLDTHTPSPIQQHSPTYAPSGSTRVDPGPMGQYPPQYRPSQSPIQEPSETVVERRPVNGSWKDV
ncbi:hypothetical protein K402DRAFT_459584 [Aulographum hederae CBS 113979]|uniref:Uncharacterized protein n=1 Tax=Aulographum hederae CBS 113979 TaxID=1176131 RepID=A0A6G1HEL4_9PEZI|nr:hypothetical protein K402DRAFT_459584 [Aulographum hederae CBS 113979]